MTIPLGHSTYHSTSLDGSFRLFFFQIHKISISTSFHQYLQHQSGKSSNLGHPTRRPAFLPCCTAVVELRRLLWARGHTPTDHSCPPPPSTSWSSSSSSSSDTRASHHLSDHSDTLCWSPFMKPSQYRRLERVMFKPVYLVDSGCGFYCVD